MSDPVTVALIGGGIALLNGPILLAIFNNHIKKTDETKKIREDINKLSKLVDRIGDGLNIGLRNDKVIFEALRKNSINGESERQEQIMDEYFTNCAVSGFSRDNF
jgi:glutaredoxin 2